MAATPLDARQPSAARWSIPFINDGGPLLVLPPELVSSWEGCDPPSAGRTITTRFDDELGQFGGTDYARACAAGGWVSALPVGHATGIVLGADDFAFGVRWLHLPEVPGVFLSIPVYAEHDYQAFLIEEL